LWRNRRRFIAEAERAAAERAYANAIAKYLQIAKACPDDGLVVSDVALDP
jgi:hypothetical protein